MKGKKNKVEELLRQGERERENEVHDGDEASGRVGWEDMLKALQYWPTVGPQKLILLLHLQK